MGIRRSKGSADLDDAMESQEAWEAKEKRLSSRTGGRYTNKELVGSVEQFFDRLNVAAIRLTGALKVGDIIEIGSEEEAIRQRVSSMQINRKDVDKAGDGDSVGIKVRCRVPEGSDVYRVAV